MQLLRGRTSQTNTEILQQALNHKNVALNGASVSLSGTIKGQGC